MFEHLSIIFADALYLISIYIALIICARAIFQKEPTVLRLEAPFSICGDIHGQYYDLLRVLDAGGFPPDTKYLFLGGFV